MPIKHGLYSRIKRQSLQEKLEVWRQVKGTRLTDLSEEILIAKAMVESHLEEMPTDDQGMVVLTQRGMADLAGFLGVWLERVAKLTETADRIKRGNRLVISTETVDRLLEAVTQILMTYVPEDKQEEALNALRDASR